MRGNSLNPMLPRHPAAGDGDARFGHEQSCAMPEHLFTRVVTVDVQAAGAVTREQGYEPSGDYLVSLHPVYLWLTRRRWGMALVEQNEWIKQSLLVHFHNEARAVKGFYPVERLMREPKRYQIFAGILYICFRWLSRALQSRRVRTGEFDKIYRRLYHVLHMRGDAPFAAAP